MKPCRTVLKFHYIYQCQNLNKYCGSMLMLCDWHVLRPSDAAAAVVLPKFPLIICLDRKSEDFYFSKEGDK